MLSSDLCVKCFLLQQKEISLKTVRHLATILQAAYDVLQEIFDKFEEGQLKGQTLTRKELMATPDMGRCAYAFSNLSTLPDDAVLRLLTDVRGGLLSSTELASEATHLRKLMEVERSFVALMGCDSWEEAVQQFPEQTTREVMARFIGGTRTISDQRLVSFCQTILDRKKRGDDASPAAVISGNAEGYILTGDVRQLQLNQLHDVWPTFRGSELVIVDPPKVRYMSLYTCIQILK